MQLSELANKLGLSVEGGADVEIRSVTQDSRKAGPGVLFAALPGATVNGLDYVHQAMANGASALLLPSWAVPSAEYTIPVLGSDDCRSSFAKSAAYMAGSLPHNRIAITGTNGKTSVAHFARELLAKADFPAASAGTLGLVPSELGQLPALTTPDPVALFNAMANVKHQGYDHFLVEASSHGMDQRRIDGFDPNVTVFTNLSRDHLDYHVGMAAYAEAKFRLFRTLMDPKGVIVNNVDDEFSQRISCLSRQFITYGNKPSDLHIRSVSANEAGQTFDLGIFGERMQIQVPQIGAYQAHNLMAALGVTIGCGVDQQTAIKLLQSLSGVPGRMEIAASKGNKLAIVDYAHTPDALEVALKSARPHASGQLKVVFGAGGDRDAGKRPLMGKAASVFADVAYVTDDNPRSEDPKKIRAAVMQGGEGLIDAKLIDAGDRGHAIALALSQAKSGDVILIAGKGHETTQDIGGEKQDFDDRLVTAELAKDLW